MKLLTTQLKKPTSVLLVANVVSLALGLVSAALQARLLGPEGRGELATAMVPAGIAAMLLCFGLPDYFARQAAKGGTPRELSLAAGSLSLIIGVLVFVPYILAAELLAPRGSQAWYLLTLYAILTPVTIFGYCLLSLSNGAGWWKTVAVSKVAPQFAAVLGLAALFVFEASPAAVGTILIAATIMGLLFPLSRKATWPTGRFSRQSCWAALGFGIRGWPSGALALLNQRIDLLLLTAIASHEHIGYYAVATTLAAVLTAVSNAVAIPTRNRVANGETHILPSITANTMAATTVVASIVALALPMLVMIILGESFLPAIPVMLVLLAAQVPLAGVVVLTQSLIAAGKPSHPFAGEAAAMLVTVTLLLSLLPQFGILAAAWANLAGTVVSFSVLLFLSHRFVSPGPLWHFIVPMRRVSNLNQRTV